MSYGTHVEREMMIIPDLFKRFPFLADWTVGDIIVFNSYSMKKKKYFVLQYLTKDGRISGRSINGKKCFYFHVEVEDLIDSAEMERHIRENSLPVSYDVYLGSGITLLNLSAKDRDEVKNIENLLLPA